MKFDQTKLSLIPEHCRGAVLRYLEQGIPPDSFLTAVFSNDLVQAHAKADHINESRLKDYCQFLYWEVPGACWGSPERVRQWIDGGGLQGRSRNREQN